MYPDFKNPPLNEVVIATYFSSPLADLRTEHIGLFWAQIRDAFPTALQRPPVPMEDITAGTEVFPTPRYWFVSQDDASLLQVQKSAFMFNWRRRADAYPRFRIIKPQFDRYYDLFADFVRTDLGASEPTVDLCELTYINAIHRCDFWAGPPDTPKVLPAFSLLLPGIEGFASTGFNCSFAFERANDMRLSVGVRSGLTVDEPILPILLIEIKATAKLSAAAKPDVDGWFDRAHMTVMDCFLSITDRTIQNEYWQRVETP